MTPRGNLPGRLILCMHWSRRIIDLEIAETPRPTDRTSLSTRKSRNDGIVKTA